MNPARYYDMAETASDLALRFSRDSGLKTADRERGQGEGAAIGAEVGGKITY